MKQSLSQARLGHGHSYAKGLEDIPFLPEIGVIEQATVACPDNDAAGCMYLRQVPGQMCG